MAIALGYNTIEGADPAPLRALRFADWISQRVHTAMLKLLLSAPLRLCVRKKSYLQSIFDIP
ncbi:MAG: hypothetical protein AN486_17250 [Anabaena sp. AL93]|jgi:hypothetical protein|nr:MAG: hypothetical protein AN486_17250 [Anabaena sp. AL93]